MLDAASEEPRGKAGGDLSIQNVLGEVQHGLRLILGGVEVVVASGSVQAVPTPAGDGPGGVGGAVSFDEERTRQADQPPRGGVHPEGGGVVAANPVQQRVAFGGGEPGVHEGNDREHLGGVGHGVKMAAGGAPSATGRAELVRGILGREASGLVGDEVRPLRQGEGASGSRVALENAPSGVLLGTQDVVGRRRESIG